MVKTNFTATAEAIAQHAQALFAESTPKPCPDFKLTIVGDRVEVKAQLLEFRSLGLVIRRAAREAGFAEDQVKYAGQLVPAQKNDNPRPRRRRGHKAAAPV